MPQLSYQIDTTIAVEGALADTTTKDTVSRVSATDLGRGRFVIRDSTAALNDKGVKLPTADFVGSGDQEGVSMFDPTRVPTDGGLNFAQGTEIPVLRSGRIWVVPEDAVTTGGPVFARFTSGGGGAVLGRFRSDADTASAAQVASGRWMSSTTGADELAILAINLPTTSAA